MRSEEIQELDSLLVTFVIGYSSEEGEVIDVFKVIYIASLYLYAHAMTPTTTGVTGLACALIAKLATNLSPQERVQITRFVIWLYEKEVASGKQRLEHSKASLLLCIYIVIPSPTEALLNKANAIFRVEVAAIGPPADNTTVQASLEEVEKMDPSFDAKMVLEQIGGASASGEIGIFRNVMKQANLDATKVAMLNPTY
jgi:hypothetical protein